MATQMSTIILTIKKLAKNANGRSKRSLDPPKDNIYGGLEYVDGREVIGWAMDIKNVSHPLQLQIMLGDVIVGSTVTNIPRQDVETAYSVQGDFGFTFHAPRPFSDEEIDAIRVYLPEHGRFLNSRDAVRSKNAGVSHAGRDLRVHIANIESLRQLAQQAYEWVRIDPILNCNVKCVYCHNYRTTGKFEMDDMERFIHEKISSTMNFQVGCTMEPTLDPRLCDIFEMVGRSPAKPTGAFKLATNATLLHRHDCERLVAAGLNNITVSIDTFDPVTLRRLRGGTSVQRVADNVSFFIRNFPSVDITFTATVTKLNIKQLKDFVASSLDLGIRSFIFHEVFYFPENGTVSEEKMTELLLAEGEFYEAKREITTKFGGIASFLFAHDVFMKRVHKECGLDDKWESVSRKAILKII